MLDRPLRVGMLIGTTSFKGGGVPQAMSALCSALSQIPGISLDVFSLDPGQDPGLDLGLTPVHLAKPSGPSGFGYAADLGAIVSECQPDLLHVHGLWMYQSIVALNWHRRTGRPYIVSPHGMLDRWALRNRFWKKWLARRLYEDAHLNNAACVHALCQAEKTAIRSAGILRPVVVLPNGVEIIQSSSGPPAWRRNLPGDARILMFLGRLTPKKGVGELIRAWARISHRDTRWHLVLVGPDEGGYAGRLKALAASGTDCGRIHIVGPAYGEERSRAFASANAFILPSISEGLPLAALEALSMGIPALLSEQCNVPEAFESGCALPVGTSDDAIGMGLERLFSLSARELEDMGMRGKALVDQNFNWSTIAVRFADLYRRLVEGAPGQVQLPDDPEGWASAGVAGHSEGNTGLLAAVHRN